MTPKPRKPPPSVKRKRAPLPPVPHMTIASPTHLIVPIQTVSLTNVRVHWAKKHRLAREQRGGIRQALKALVPEQTLPVRVWLFRISPRMLDDDNLRSALKSIRDGVADWLGVDDRDPRVQWEYHQYANGARVFGVRVEFLERGP